MIAELHLLQSRIRIDGVNIDHLQTSKDGPVSWITSGKLDPVLDIKFPKDPDDALALNVILEEIADAKMVIELDLRFRDVKAVEIYE